MVCSCCSWACLVAWQAGGQGAAFPAWPFMLFPALAMLRALCMIKADVAAAQAGIVARRRLRGEVMASILAGGPALLRRTHSGVLASIVVDRIEALDGFFGRWVPASVLWMVAPVLILLPVGIMQPRAAVILGLCGVAVPVGQAVFGIGAAVASRNQFLAMTRLQARFLDRIKGIATIVLAGRTEDETRRLGDAAEELRVRTMKVLRVAFLSSASIDCAMVIAFILLAVLDGRQALAMQASGPSLALQHTVVASLFALLAVPEFFAPLRGLALAYQDRAHAQGAATAILDLPEVTERPVLEGARTVNANGVMVAFDDVGFTWDPARGPALEHVTFTVPAGETLVLAGPSGAGKSTIMELLLGFITPQNGRVLFNGAPLQSIVPDALSRVVSWIGQKPVLFAGSCGIISCSPNQMQTSVNWQMPCVPPPWMSSCRPCPTGWIHRSVKVGLVCLVGRRNVLPLRALTSKTPRFCCWMNPPRIWTLLLKKVFLKACNGWPLVARLFWPRTRLRLICSRGGG